ncbi:MAG: hypothetical protein QM535_03300 [Limnohabitans sp.]|nr:hypothetical protein [Limnohabitans sp.]
MKKTNEIETWKKEYIEILKFTLEDQVAYCKVPTYEIYLKFKQLGETKKHEAILQLFNDCLLNKGEFDDEFQLSSGNELINKIKEYHQFSISAVPGEDEYKKSAALIRYYFKVNPYELTMKEFYKLLEEALWLQKHNNNKLENIVQKVITETYSN